jgi:hypothetical protein
MSGVQIIGGTSHLDDEVAEFAERITPAIARWEYAAKASRKLFYSKYVGAWINGLNAKAVPALSRVTGAKPRTVTSRVWRICNDGIDLAIEYARDYDEKYVAKSKLLRPFFEVGTLPEWCCGHIYFARVKTHPHVIKVGFSRRVSERLDDIASRHKVQLILPDRDHIKVGTQADEHWWHGSWERFNITGEWFFDPKSTDRSLPSFLADFARAEAA